MAVVLGRCRPRAEVPGIAKVARIMVHPLAKFYENSDTENRLHNIRRVEIYKTCTMKEEIEEM